MVSEIEMQLRDSDYIRQELCDIHGYKPIKAICNNIQAKISNVICSYIWQNCIRIKKTKVIKVGPSSDHIAF